MQLRNYVRNNKSTMAGAELRFQQLSEYIYIILLSLSRDGTFGGRKNAMFGTDRLDRIPPALSP